MVSISSTKTVSPVYSQKLTVSSQQTGTYTVTAVWSNVGNGFSITIPQTGMYILKAGFTVRCDGPGGDAEVAIGIDGVNIANTSRRAYESDHTSIFPVHLETIPTLCSAGQVITLRAYEPDAGTSSIYYMVGDKIGYIEAELMETVVPVMNGAANLNYSTSEINTGLKWIDGKDIYRRVWSGTTGAGVSSTLALGFTIDMAVKWRLLVDSSTYSWMEAGVASANLSVYFTNTSKNDVTLYHGSAHMQSRPYRLIIEYTK